MYELKKRINAEIPLDLYKNVEKLDCSITEAVINGLEWKTCRIKEEVQKEEIKEEIPKEEIKEEMPKEEIKEEMIEIAIEPTLQCEIEEKSRIINELKNINLSLSAKHKAQAVTIAEHQKQIVEKDYLIRNLKAKLAQPKKEKSFADILTGQRVFGLWIDALLVSIVVFAVSAVTFIF
jgi:hypothetical protein